MHQLNIKHFNLILCTEMKYFKLRLQKRLISIKILQKVLHYLQTDCFNFLIHNKFRYFDCRGENQARNSWGFLAVLNNLIPTQI